MKAKSNIKAKEELLQKLHKRCCLVQDFFIEVKKRKGKNYQYNLEVKNHLKEILDKNKNDEINVTRLIDGYRQLIKDDNQNIRNYLSKEDQEKLRKILKDNFGDEEF